MIKKIASILVLTTLLTAAFGQEATTTKKRVGQPDIPGNFMVEFGFNRAPGSPSNFDLGFIGSRTFNVYYQYDIRIAKSKFSVVPGIGLSLERFKFNNNNIVGLKSGGNNADTLTMLPPSLSGIPGIRKSHLVTNYLEVPLEIRFSTKPDDPARSIKISVGARAGILYDSFNKVKYKEGGETKKFKDKQGFSLNDFRYGLTGRLGIGGFSLFGYYNLSTLFKEGEGLVENRQPVDFNTFTVGISLSSF